MPLLCCGAYWPGLTVRICVTAWVAKAAHAWSPGASSAQTFSWPSILAGVDSHSAPIVTISSELIQDNSGAYVLSLPPPLRRTSRIQLGRAASAVRCVSSSLATAAR
ncbi:hypothetical protein O0881_09475 [Janthinobacterium sp. SUN100]|nr:hypothetical protein [Janthinobacterium sp. SUN100]MDN2702222.1 hypothetical protein [Janthinobacterium sp. SUN100]